MAPPHIRVCGWRHITRQATFLASVIKLGETRSSLRPARCDDTTVNHPNHFLLWFRAYALNSHTEQTGQTEPGATARGARGLPLGPTQQARVPGIGQLGALGPMGCPFWVTPKTLEDLWLAGGEAEPLTAQIAHRLQPLLPGTLRVWAPVTGGNGPRRPSVNLGFRV